jgi:2,4-diaminopentanoate dehydrogenase
MGDPDDRSDRRWRVAQWTTGIVGGAALRAIIRDPSLELVSVFAHSPMKVGVDAGELAAVDPVGVQATDDLDAVLATQPDCLVYMPQWPVVEELEQILAAGVNVVTTARLVDGRHYPEGTGARLEAAAHRGGATLLGTGMNPMFVSTVALAATAMCASVRHVRIVESMDCGLYGGAGTWQAYGFGREPDVERVRAELLGAEPDYLEALDQVAEALDTHLDDYELEIDLATANEDRDLGWMVIGQGTVSAIDSRWIGLVDGEPFVEMRSTWKLGSIFGYGDTPDWPLLHGYRIDIDGDPNVKVKLNFVPDDMETFDIGIGTALPAINAIGHVCRARPGVIGVADLPLVTSRRSRA